MAKKATWYYSVRRVGDATAELKRMERRLFPADKHEDDARTQWWEVRTPKGELVAFASACIVNRICYLTACGVSKEHRGHRLQAQLIRARENWGGRRGCLVVATHVRYTNIHSLNNLVDRGYRACRPREVGWTKIDPDFIVLQKKAP